MHGLVAQPPGSPARAKTRRSLHKLADHPQWPASLLLLVNGLAQAGRVQEAKAWLPLLQQSVPQEAFTRWLAQQH